MMLVLVCWQVRANSLWSCIRLWKICIVTVLNLMMLNSNYIRENFVTRFTEVLTVNFSVKPWEVTMEPTERLPSHHGRMLNLGKTR